MVYIYWIEHCSELAIDQHNQQKISSTNTDTCVLYTRKVQNGWFYRRSENVFVISLRPYYESIREVNDTWSRRCGIFRGPTQSYYTSCGRYHDFCRSIAWSAQLPFEDLTRFTPPPPARLLFYKQTRNGKTIDGHESGRPVHDAHKRRPCRSRRISRDRNCECIYRGRPYRKFRRNYRDSEFGNRRVPLCCRGIDSHRTNRLGTHTPYVTHTRREQ
jgi:hypothetical protein